MTEEELRRQEFVEERIAILTESGMEEHQAIKLAQRLWGLWEQDRQVKS